MKPENHPDASSEKDDKILERDTPSSVNQGDEGLIEKPLAEQFSEIVRDARTLVDTELSYFRARVDASVGATKKVLALFGLGLAFGTAGLTALVLGILMTLAPYLGAGLATTVVAGGFCILGAILLLMAANRAKKIPADPVKNE